MATYIPKVFRKYCVVLEKLIEVRATIMLVLSRRIVLQFGCYNISDIS